MGISLNSSSSVITAPNTNSYCCFWCLCFTDLVFGAFALQTWQKTISQEIVPFKSLLTAAQAIKTLLSLLLFFVLMAFTAKFVCTFSTS